jgi:hypothetical protein
MEPIVLIMKGAENINLYLLLHQHHLLHLLLFLLPHQAHNHLLLLSRMYQKL